jgi:hypothetical protein
MVKSYAYPEKKLLLDKKGICAIPLFDFACLTLTDKNFKLSSKEACM